MATAAGWLQERLENLYKKDPGYSDKAASLFTLDLQSPQELPDNLRGEQWNFVQLPLSALMDELKQVKQVVFFTLLATSTLNIYMQHSIPAVLQSLLNAPAQQTLVRAHLLR